MKYGQGVNANTVTDLIMSGIGAVYGEVGAAYWVQNQIYTKKVGMSIPETPGFLLKTYSEALYNAAIKTWTNGLLGY